MLSKCLENFIFFFYYPLHCTVDCQFWPPSAAVSSAIDDISISFSHCCCLPKAMTKLLHFACWNLTRGKNSNLRLCTRKSPHIFLSLVCLQTYCLLITLAAKISIFIDHSVVKTKQMRCLLLKVSNRENVHRGTRL